MFQLVYEGPQNSEADTVRKIKSALLSKLNFSVDEIREIIEKTPSTIVTADDESALEEYYEELKSAGARVYIVREKQNIEIEFSLDDEESKPEPKVFSISEENEELPVYEVSEEEEPIKPEHEKAIELNEDESLEDLLQVLGNEEEQDPISIKEEPKSEEAVKEDLFTFGEKESEPVININKESNKEPEKKLKPIDFSFDDESEKPVEQKVIEKVEEKNDWDLTVEGVEDIVPDVPIVKGSVSPTGDEVDLDSMLEEVQAIAPKIEEPKVEETPVSLKIEKPAVVEKPVEEAAQQLPIQKENHLPLLLMTLVLVMALWGANHFYFMNKETESKTVETPKPVKVANEKKVPKSLNRDLKGALVVDGGTVTINLTEEQGKIKRLSIVFRGDESPKLTPEEIVRRVPRAPWIETTVFETTQFTFEDSGAAVTNGPVRISIQDDKQTRRVIGTGTANIILNGDTAEVSFYSTYQTSSRVTGVKKENGSLAVSVVFDTKVELK